jgi:hypothetical protein
MSTQPFYFLFGAVVGLSSSSRSLAEIRRASLRVVGEVFVVVSDSEYLEVDQDGHPTGFHKMIHLTKPEIHGKMSI